MNLSYAHCYNEFKNSIKNQNKIELDSINQSNELNDDQENTKNDNQEKDKDDEQVYIQTNDLTFFSDFDSSDKDTSFSDLTNTDLSDSSSNNAPSEIELEDSTKSPGPSRKKIKKESSTDSDYLINSREYGNVSRFFNHSCSANLECNPVFIETQNPIFTHFAFFTIKDLKAFTELTFNYFKCEETDNDVDYFKCKCRSKKCKTKSKGQ